MHGERVAIAEVCEPVDATLHTVSASDDGTPDDAQASDRAARSQPTQHASASRRGGHH